MMKFTFFVHLRVLPAWLALSRDERGKIASVAFGSAMVSDEVSLRYFDAEAFTGCCTDVAMFESKDLKAYYFTIERLKDTLLFSVPYFEIVEIIPAIEEGFRTFEAEEQLPEAPSS